MTLRLLLASVVLVSLGVGAVGAHPHVWIENKARLEVADGHLAAIHHHWIFDTFFGDFVINEFDTDWSGSFDEDEIAAIRDEAFIALAEFSFLTHLRVDGETRRFDEVEGFEAAIEDGLVVYRFTVPLETPVDLAASDVVIGVYDETYYIDVAWSTQQPLTVEGGVSCSHRLRDDEANPIYFGMVYPTVAEISCAAS